MNISKKKGLGRGLSALFGDEKPSEKPKEINSNYLINSLSVGLASILAVVVFGIKFN